LSKLEVGGMNAEKYKALFKTMDDKQFLAFFKRIKEDDNAHLYIETDLYNKNRITMDSIEVAAKHIGVPLEEYVYTRHKTKDGSSIRSKSKIPVMYIHLKRMQQLLSKKVRTNVDITSGNVRSRITGSLDSSNKTGRFTDMDTQILVSVTSETGIEAADGTTHSPIMFEILQARADNNSARSAMLQQISFLGETNLPLIYQQMTKNGTQNPELGQAAKTMDIYYLGAGLQTNFVNSSYLTKQGTAKA
jgi:hypothetical protein